MIADIEVLFIHLFLQCTTFHFVYYQCTRLPRHHQFNDQQIIQIEYYIEKKTNNFVQIQVKLMEQHITLYLKSLRESITLALLANLTRMSLDLDGLSHRSKSRTISSCLVRLASSISKAVDVNISARRTASSIFLFSENKPEHV